MDGVRKEVVEREIERERKPGAIGGKVREEMDRLDLKDINMDITRKGKKSSFIAAPRLRRKLLKREDL